MKSLLSSTTKRRKTKEGISYHMFAIDQVQLLTTHSIADHNNFAGEYVSPQFKDHRSELMRHTGQPTGSLTSY